MKRNHTAPPSAAVLATLILFLALGRAGAARPPAQQPAAPPGDQRQVALPAPLAANIALIDRLGGATSAAAVQDGLAYVGEGSQLSILDVSDPTAPLLLGKSRPFTGLVSRVAVAGPFVYLLAGGNLVILNAADPAAPRAAAAVDFQGRALDLTLSGEAAYVAAGEDGLHILDIRDPASVAPAGHFSSPDPVRRIAVAGAHAYLGAGMLRILDVSDPAAPVEIAAGEHCPGVGRGIAISDVAVSGENVFLTGSIEEEYLMGALCVVRVSDPANPYEVARHYLPNGAYAVDLAGNLAFIPGGGGNTRLFIFDVTHPKWPWLRAEVATPGLPAATAAAGNLAYVAATGGGLRILDISSPDAPFETGFYQPLGVATNLALDGDRAYVAGDTALGILDLAAGGPLATTAVLNMPRGDSLAEAFGVAAAGDLAAVALGWDGVRLVDVANPAAPALVGLVSEGGAIYDVALDGDFAYLADRGFAHDQDGLRIVDVADPAAPAAAGFYDTPGWPNGVTLVGSSAYVADGEGGLRFIDVSDPQQPAETGFVDTPGFAWDTVVDGDTAYVAESSGGLAIVDLQAPALLGHYPFAEPSWGAAADGDLAYVAADESGLRLLDVSDPADPREIGFYDTPGRATAVALSGPDILVADSMGGLLHLRYLPWRAFAPLVVSDLPQGAAALDKAASLGLAD